MVYKRETVYCGKRAEVREYFAAHGGLRKRSPKLKPTPEKKKRAYLRRKERELRWLLNENFRDQADALVTFSWPKGINPGGYAEVLQAAQKLTRKLRKEYKTYGLELKYVYTMEIGPKGSRHIHMVLSNVNYLLLCACWPYATIDIKPLWSKGEYGDIAAYFLKYWNKTSETEGLKLGKRCYNPSKNLQKPKIIKQTIRRSDVAKDPPKLKGYILDSGSVMEGITEITERRYRECRYWKLQTADEPPAETVIQKVRSIFRKLVRSVANRGKP